MISIFSLKGSIQVHLKELSKLFFLVYFVTNSSELKCLYLPNKAITYIYIITDVAVRNKLRATTDCICPNQNATYECTTFGGEFTLWNGSIIPPGCEVVLSHAQFFNDTSLCCCNDPTVVGNGLQITNDSCYTSILTVLVTPELNGKNVSCVVDYGLNMGEVLIDTMTINITTGKFSLIITEKFRS